MSEHTTDTGEPIEDLYRESFAKDDRENAADAPFPRRLFDDLVALAQDNGWQHVSSFYKVGRTTFVQDQREIRIRWSETGGTIDFAERRHYNFPDDKPWTTRDDHAPGERADTVREMLRQPAIDQIDKPGAIDLQNKQTEPARRRRQHELTRIDELKHLIRNVETTDLGGLTQRDADQIAEAVWAAGYRTKPREDRTLDWQADQFGYRETGTTVSAAFERGTDYQVVWIENRETHTYIADDERDARAYAAYLRTTERGAGIRAQARTVVTSPWSDLS